MCYIQAFINKLNLWRQHFDFSLTIFLSLGKKKKKWCSEIKSYQRHRQRIINDIFLKYWVDVHGCDLAILTHSNLKIRNLRVQKNRKSFLHVDLEVLKLWETLKRKTGNVISKETALPLSAQFLTQLIHKTQNFKMNGLINEIIPIMDKCCESTPSSPPIIWCVKFSENVIWKARTEQCWIN